MEESSLVPVPASRRTLTGLDLAGIWFGAAIVISECWAGGLPALAGLGLGAGLIAILIGRLIGNGLMGAMAGVGARTGLPTMVLTRPSFGVRGSILPAVFNVAQLVGWTAFMYYVGYLYLRQLGVALGLPSMKWVWIGALAVLCTLCSFAGASAWHRVLKVVVAGMFLLTVWMSVLVFSRFPPAEVFRMRPAGGTNLLLGTDLVVAMSVSWLPLVADYSRFGRSVRTSALGTFGGYLLGGAWMYAVGLLVAVAVGTDSPDQIVVATMAGAGRVPVVLGLLLVLVSTVTTTFLDLYSAVVSAQNVFPRIPARAATVVVGLGSAALAGFLHPYDFEPFLLVIGAVFLPVFTVVLADRFLGAGGSVETAEIDRRGGRYWFRGGFRPEAIVATIAGFLVFDLASGWPSVGTIAGLFGGHVSGKPWPTGASLPAIAFTTVLYLGLAAATRRSRG